MSRATSKDGTSIAYDKTGTGPAVILVDGAMGFREQYGGRPLAATLSRDFLAVTYDRRGRGESADTPPYAVEREIEDIEALIDEVGAPVFLYGMSSGAVLALRAASRLGERNVAALAMQEPPFSTDNDGTQEFARYDAELRVLLDANQRDDAVAFFLSDMMPPDMLDALRHSPEWQVMESVAHTLAYDNDVMGDSGVPAAIAGFASMRAMVLVGDQSPDFKREAAEELVDAMPRAELMVLAGQDTRVSPEILGPALRDFFLSAE